MGYLFCASPYELLCARVLGRAQVVRYVQIGAGDVDTEMLQDAARQQAATASV